MSKINVWAGNRTLQKSVLHHGQIMGITRHDPVSHGGLGIFAS